MERMFPPSPQRIARFRAGGETGSAREVVLAAVAAALALLCVVAARSLPSAIESWFFLDDAHTSTAVVASRCFSILTIGLLALSSIAAVALLTWTAMQRALWLPRDRQANLPQTEQSLQTTGKLAQAFVGAVCFAVAVMWCYLSANVLAASWQSLHPLTIAQQVLAYFAITMVGFTALFAAAAWTVRILLVRKRMQMTREDVREEARESGGERKARFRRSAVNRPTVLLYNERASCEIAVSGVGPTFIRPITRSQLRQQQRMADAHAIAFASCASSLCKLTPGAPIPRAHWDELAGIVARSRLAAATEQA